MKYRNNPPYAPNLIESMRSIGYSFETALADIIDNSIAANAKHVEVISLVEGERSYISIVDDGCGMNSKELFNAMKYGSTNPTKKRNPSDMGRFGLGLKSASLSQCRKLTVISKKDNELSAFIWDIDYIIECGNWNIQELESNEIHRLFCYEKINDMDHGTIVIWEKFDRIEESCIDLDETLKTLLVNAIDHLSLIYHRLIGSKFNITINGFNISPKDPFLEFHPSTQLKREQKIKIDNSIISVKPYILPHINKLSNDDIRDIGGKESLRLEQGFYIYRNKRLIIWGTWFRLGSKNELTKLARVKVDIPNDMDYIWNIDIKKSKASLPEKIKLNLYNAVTESCQLSENVHVYRGKRIVEDNFMHTWNVIEKRKNEGVSLEINTDEPIITGFVDTLNKNQKKAFFSIITDIESNLPLDYIYTELAKGKKTKIELSLNEKIEIINKVKEKLEIFQEIGMSKDEFLDAILAYEKYSGDEFIKENIEKLRGK